MKKLFLSVFFLAVLPTLSFAQFSKNPIIKDSGTLVEGQGRILDYRTGMTATFDSVTGEYKVDSSGSGSGNNTIVVQIEDVSLAASTDTLDFQSCFDGTQSATTESNISLDLSECTAGPVTFDTSNNSGLNLSHIGVSGQISTDEISGATDDSVLLGNGTHFTPITINDCNAAGEKLNYDQATNAWSCPSEDDPSVDTEAEIEAILGIGFGTKTATAGNILIADGVDFETQSVGNHATIDTSGNIGVQANAIDSQSEVTATTNDMVLILDATDSGLKKADVTSFFQLGDGNTKNFADLDDTAISGPASAEIPIYDGSDSWDNKPIKNHATIDTSGNLGLNVNAIESQTEVTPTTGDTFLIRDDTDGTMKKADVSTLIGGGAGGGGSGTMTTVERTDSQVGGADIVTLDFQDSFSITESPNTEINISLVKNGHTHDDSSVANAITINGGTFGGTISGDATFSGNITNIASPWQDNEVEDNITISGGTISGTISGSPTLSGNWTNTAFPWQDNEVDDNITIGSGTISSSAITLDTGANPTTDGQIRWDTTTERIEVGDDGVATLDFYSGAHTTDTGPSPDCAGTTTYQDGEGNCDDISTVYEAFDTNITKDNENETITANWTNTAFPWQDNEVEDNITVGSGTISGSISGSPTLSGNWDFSAFPLQDNEIQDNITVGGGTISGTITGSPAPTGAWDFGGATSLEVPNAAAPTTDAAGELALDTTIASHTDLLQYGDGSTSFYVIAIPTANLTTTNGDAIKYNATNDNFEMGSITASGTTFLETSVVQTTHGLAVNDIIRLSGGDTYTKAQANSAANAEVAGIVTAVADGNNFTFCYSGMCSALTGLTANTIYFLDDDTAGLITSTEPPDNGDISKPVCYAVNANTCIFLPMRGIEVTTVSGDTNAFAQFQWSAPDSIPIISNGATFDGIAPISKDDGTNNEVLTASFDDTADECRGVMLDVPEDIDTSGTAQFYVSWYSQTATSGDVMWFFGHRAGNEGESWDRTYILEAASADTTQGTVDQITETVWTETLSNLGWTADETVHGLFCRDGDVAGDTLVGDAEAILFKIELPRS